MEFIKVIHEMCEAARTLPVPTIAATKGACYGKDDAPFLIFFMPTQSNSLNENVFYVYRRGARIDSVVRHAHS
jgi:hypothetical protein